MKKALKEKLQQRLNKALEPPRPVRADDSDALVGLYAAPQQSPLRSASNEEAISSNEEAISPTDFAPPKSGSLPIEAHQALQNGRLPDSVRLPDFNILTKNSLTESEGLRQEKTVRLMQSLPVLEGYMRFWHQMTDQLYGQLTLAEQSVHIQLFRLSWGRGFPTCKIGLPRLCERTGIKSQTTTHSALKGLIKKGLVRKVGLDLGRGREQGNEYFIVPPPASIDKLSRSEIERLSIYGSLTDFGSLTESDSNKEKIYKETHTNREERRPLRHSPSLTPRVGVEEKSRFSLKECRAYAENLAKSGQGITNPGGYATKIHRSGEADELIAAFLAPSEPSVRVDASLCPDCRGTGFYEPAGAGKGVAKCKHERLQIS